MKYRSDWSRVRTRISEIHFVDNPSDDESGHDSTWSEDEIDRYDDDNTTKSSPDVARWLARELQKRRRFYGPVTRERTPITFDDSEE